MDGILLVVLVIVLALVAAGSAILLLQILKQQGRMMLRLDSLEHLVGAAHGAGSNTPVGPPVGAAADPFTLPDLDGKELSLDQYRGRKVLLVNWSPTCGYCDMIGEDLVAAAPDLEKANTALLLLTRGDADTNRAQADRLGIQSPILLMGDANPSGFQNLGTPAALLVDEKGKVASPLVIGADKVPELVGSSLGANGSGKKLRGQRSVSESRLERDGLKAGTPAPSFTLPDIHGGQVSLEQFRGRQVLLAFSSPDCGPCDALAPHLVEIDRQHGDNGLAVVLVGRGDVEENRKKAEQYGFRFPVVLQDGWKVSKEYGIFATPVAFLIDESGTIATNVAKGVDEILALVPAPRTAGGDRR